MRDGGIGSGWLITGCAIAACATAAEPHDFAWGACCATACATAAEPHELPCGAGCELEPQVGCAFAADCEAEPQVGCTGTGAGVEIGVWTDVIDWELAPTFPVTDGIGVLDETGETGEKVAGIDEIARGLAKGMTFADTGAAGADRGADCLPAEREPVGAGSERRPRTSTASCVVRSSTSKGRGTCGITRNGAA